MFVRCTLWREAAVNAASLAKGTRVIATGTLTERTYQAKDGQARASAELDVDELGASVRFAPATPGPKKCQQQPLTASPETEDQSA